MEDGASGTANLDERAFWRALFTNVQPTQARERGTPRIHRLRPLLVHGSDKTTVWYALALAIERS